MALFTHEQWVALRSWFFTSKMLLYFWKLPNTMGTKHIVLMIRLIRLTSGADRISLQSSKGTAEETDWCGCEEAKARPACSYPSKREWGSPGLTDTPDSHKSYSLSPGSATCPVFFVSMDKSVLCSATRENTCSLSFLDFQTCSANVSGSWWQSQWQKSICEQPEGSHQFILHSDKVIFRL